ncbi:MAG TPA: hypothetical protein VFY04_11255 [Solirubrobacterales bacterium]|nr:hypothetical protein [Solirubrobacterales bacterium]
MEFRLAMEREHADDLARLADWLRDEPELRGRIRHGKQEPRPGEMDLGGRRECPR